jgi:hypothetical protein
VGATAYTSAVTDPDGDSMTYALSGADASSFAVSTTGVVTLGSALDFEDDETYAFTVTASDGNGETGSVDVTGAVVDRTDSPFTVKSTIITASNKPLGVDGSVGDIMVSVEAAFTDFDTKVFGDYEASEINYFDFSMSGSTDLEDLLVTQSQTLSGTAKYTTGAYNVNATSPDDPYDIGITKVNMIKGSTTVENLALFVLDKSKVSADFDIIVSGKYTALDYGADDAASGNDNTTTTHDIDPFIFTVDIA